MHNTRKIHSKRSEASCHAVCQTQEMWSALIPAALLAHALWQGGKLCPHQARESTHFFGCQHRNSFSGHLSDLAVSRSGAAICHVPDTLHLAQLRVPMAAEGRQTNAPPHLAHGLLVLHLQRLSTGACMRCPVAETQPTETASLSVMDYLELCLSTRVIKSARTPCMCRS